MDKEKARRGGLMIEREAAELRRQLRYLAGSRIDGIGSFVGAMADHLAGEWLRRSIGRPRSVRRSPSDSSSFVMPIWLH
jgi:hypothetical protein